MNEDRSDPTDKFREFCQDDGSAPRPRRRCRGHARETKGSGFPRARELPAAKTMRMASSRISPRRAKSPQPRVAAAGSPRRRSPTRRAASLGMVRIRRATFESRARLARRRDRAGRGGLRGTARRRRWLPPETARGRSRPGQRDRDQSGQRRPRSGPGPWAKTSRVRVGQRQNSALGRGRTPTPASRSAVAEPEGFGGAS